MSNNITVGFSAKDVSFTETVKKVNKSTETIDDTVKKVSKSVGASFGSMVKAGAALAVGFGALNLAGNAIAGSLADFGRALDMGGELKDLSDRTGETSGNLMVLQRAFQNAGSSADAVGPAVNKLQKFMIDAADGSEKNVEALKKLGLSFDDLKGKAPVEQLKMISERLKDVDDPAQRAAFAMGIFGKSGGALLPVLLNLSDEIGVAKSQLGSMPEVMTRSAEIFDNISDNITVIKGKFIEFAAGLMDRMAPALELVTSLLSRIDTAAIGMKLGEILTGGSNAMDGFAAALQAVNMGEFGNAFNLVFSSIKLQIADSINSIYAAIRGAMAAIPVLVEGSGILTVLMSIVDGVLSKASAGIKKIMAELLSVIGLDDASAEMSILGKADESAAENYFNTVRNGLADMAQNTKATMAPMREAYDDAVKKAGKLVDTVAMENELQSEKLRLLKAQNEEAIKKINMDEVALSLQIKGGGERASNAEKIKEFEADISQARSEGNTQLVKELEQQKLYYTTFERALKEGKSTSEAMTAATQAQGSSLQNNLSIEQQITAQKKEQLTASQQMNADIKKAEEGQRLDSSGKIKERFDEAMGAGNLASARRQARTLAGREENIKLQDMFDKVTDAIPSKINTSVADMAKELLIDTKGMDRKETEKAVREALEKAPAIDAPGKNGQPGAPGEPKGGDGAGGPNKLEAIAEAIRDLVAKIEPKLPQMALGV
jgi:hypothetical protein